MTAIAPLFRYLLQAAAGYLLAKGYVPEAVADILSSAGFSDQVLGALIFGGTTAWFYVSKFLASRKARKEVENVEKSTHPLSVDAALERLRGNGQLRP